jgi:hypothetical protein
MSFVATSVLILVGLLLVMLGMLAAGSLEMMGLGVAAIFGAAVLGTIADRGRSRT